MRKYFLAALAAAVLPLAADAGHLRHRLAERKANRTHAAPATCRPLATPVVTLASVGRAVVTAPARVFRAATCANGTCR